MTEQIYANKKGFKCVWSQLGKCDGKDPQEYAKDPLTAKKVTKEFDGVI